MLFFSSIETQIFRALWEFPKWTTIQIITRLPSSGPDWWAKSIIESFFGIEVAAIQKLLVAYYLRTFLISTNWVQDEATPRPAMLYRRLKLIWPMQVVVPGSSTVIEELVMIHPRQGQSHAEKITMPLYPMVLAMLTRAYRKRLTRVLIGWLIVHTLADRWELSEAISKKRWGDAFIVPNKSRPQGWGGVGW